MALQGQRLKYSVNMLLICILHCDASPGYLSCVQANITNIIVIFLKRFFRDCRSFTSGKLYVCQETFVCFLHLLNQAHSAKEKQLLWDEIALLNVQLILLRNNEVRG